MRWCRAASPVRPSPGVGFELADIGELFVDDGGGGGGGEGGGGGGGEGGASGP